MSKTTPKAPAPLLTLGTASTKDKAPDAHKAVHGTEQKRLNANINTDLHARFKVATMKRGQDMSKVVTELLEQWLKVNE